MLVIENFEDAGELIVIQARTRDEPRGALAAARKPAGCTDQQDAVVAVAEVLNQFRHGFTEGGVPECAESFGEALNDLMAKHWPPQGT